MMQTTIKTQTLQDISNNVLLLKDLQDISPCLTNPENVAMLQALYSRSRESVVTHIQKVEKSGSADFISSYVIGYGHDSIAECGHTVVFFENVSLLAANHLQDFPLYAGIESSTRYIDYTNAPTHIPSAIIDTGNEDLYKKTVWLYQSIMDMYHNVFDETYAYIKSQNTGQSDKSVKAAAFDVARGFLPAGITTNLSLAGSLIKIKDWLIECSCNVNHEVSLLAFCALEKLEREYPSTFSDFREKIDHIDPYIGYVNTTVNDEYLESLKQSLMDDTGTGIGSGKQIPLLNSAFSMSGISDVFMNPEFRLRIRHTQVHGFELSALSAHNRHTLKFAQNKFRLGDIFDLQFMLDYGSFRDLHRHRRGFCSMPILSLDFGFSDMYLNKVPPSILSDVCTSLNSYATRYTKLMEDFDGIITHIDTHSPFSSRIVYQYFVLLGYKHPVQYICDLTQLIYILELRSRDTVHFSLRTLTHQVYRKLVAEIPELIPYIHIDNSPTSDSFVSDKRGHQDITAIGT